MLSFHPYCLLFPQLEGVAFECLVDDIRLNGQREPILVSDGQIVDGRNRYRACVQLGIRPTTVDWDGSGDLLAIVLSRNLHRRQLNASQRACLGIRLAEIEADRAKKRMHLGRRTPGIRMFGKARDIAGRACFVSGRYIDMARRLRRRDPSAFDNVMAGRLTLTQAARGRSHRRDGVTITVCDRTTGQRHTRTVGGSFSEAIAIVDQVLAGRDA